MERVILSSFESLIAPITAERFFGEYWERAPMHIPRNISAFYQDVLTKPDLEYMISSGALRYPAIQLSKGGRFYPAEKFTHSVRSGADTFSGILSLSKLTAEFRGGATVLLPGLQRSHPPIRRFVSALEVYFNQPVQANVYLTPANASGFAPHYDTHEVFVLQIAGAKHWRIYEPVLTLPYRSQPFTHESAVPANAFMSVEMTAGDLLYLPRGYIHTTNTVGSASVHLTIGITVLTWLDLAGEIIMAAKDDAILRKALPVGFANRREAILQMQSQIKSIFERLAGDERLGTHIANFVQRTKTTPIEPEEFRIESNAS